MNKRANGKFSIAAASYRQLGTRRIVACAVVALVGATLSVLVTAASLGAKRDPIVSHQLNPFDNRPLSLAAEVEFLKDPTDVSDEAVALARKAARLQPLDARPLRILGYYEAKRGNVERASQAMRTAAAMSRREPGAQIWLATNAIERNKLGEAIGHLDTMLRSSRNTQQVVYPALLAALEVNTFRNQFATLLQSGPPWLGEFLTYYAENVEEPAHLLAMFEKSGNIPSDRQGLSQARYLLQRFADNRRFDEVRKTFALLKDPDASLTDPRFRHSDVDAVYGVLNWVRYEGPDASSSIVKENSSKNLRIAGFVDQSATRVLATKLLLLQPGTYSFSVRSNQFEGGPGSRITFRMRCPDLSSTEYIWEMEISATGTSNKQVAVPSDCPAQFLEFVGSGGNEREGMEFDLSSPRIQASQPK